MRRVGAPGVLRSNDSQDRMRFFLVRIVEIRLTPSKHMSNGKLFKVRF